METTDLAAVHRSYKYWEKSLPTLIDLQSEGARDWIQEFGLQSLYEEFWRQTLNASLCSDMLHLHESAKELGLSPNVHAERAILIEKLKNAEKIDSVQMWYDRLLDQQIYPALDVESKQLILSFWLSTEEIHFIIDTYLSEYVRLNDSVIKEIVANKYHVEQLDMLDITVHIDYKTDDQNNNQYNCLKKIYEKEIVARLEMAMDILQLPRLEAKERFGPDSILKTSSVIKYYESR